jgi:hypothetical protein
MLHLDDAVSRQTALTGAAEACGGRTLCVMDLGPALRLWTREAPLEALRGRLRAAAPRGAQADLVFAGSGDFHHITPLLIERALEAVDEPVTIVHFDNHPDWVRHAAGRHCGSWVGRAARLPGVARVITIGVCSPDISDGRQRHGDLALIREDRLDIFAWGRLGGGDTLRVGDRVWPTIASLGEPAFLAVLDAAIATSNIYVTIDKDVLAPAHAVTNWDQGQASLDFLLAAVRQAMSGRRVLGADVVGDWSRPIYGGDFAARLLKRGEAVLDQPRRQPDPDNMAVNQATNQRLLEVFLEAAA